MKYKPYPAYKDSGVEWLGMVPEGWEVKRLKYLCVFSGGGTPDTENDDFWNGTIPWVSSKDMKTESIIETEDHLSESGMVNSPAKLIPEGRVLIVVRSGILKHTIPVAINLRPVTINQDIRALFFQNSVKSEYFLRFVQGFQNELLTLWRKQGATVESIEQEYLSNTPIPIPLEIQQEAIISFLDRETSRIDTLIREYEGLIDLLAEKRKTLISHSVTKGLDPDAPMKDSGVEWLGMLPEGWEVRRNGTLFQLRKEEGKPGLPMIAISIHDAAFVDDYSEEDRESRKKSRIEEAESYQLACSGDVVYNMMRAWQGAIGAVPCEGLVSPAYIVLIPCPDLDARYVEYLFRTKNYSTEIQRHSRGITDFRLRLYWEEFKSLVCCLPPLEEQRKIVLYIESETSKIDILTKEAREAIELLKEHRAALITNAVTGKIDVREEVLV